MNANWTSTAVSNAHLDDRRSVALAVVESIARHLATPEHGRRLAGQAWWPQSLAHGAPGVALLHIERARTGHGSWEPVHAWLSCAASDAVESSTSSHLYYGAPAVAYALHHAHQHSGRYVRALDQLDHAIARTIARRLDWAHSRIDQGQCPELAEFDAIRGLTGLGAYLLMRNRDVRLLREVLTYLVRLTETNLHEDRDQLPGWWTHVGPSGRVSPEEYPGGHANNGMAHGIAGPLALLALTAHDGLTVNGHDEAIARVCAWFDRWERTAPDRTWWPYMITRSNWEQGTAPRGPQRPSWCYGSAGVARALQLAAGARAASTRRVRAERILTEALGTAPRHGIDDASVCHGHAGLALLAHLTRLNSVRQHLSWLSPHRQPHTIAQNLLHQGGIGLLEGATGTAMVLHTICTQRPTTNPPHRSSGWYAFLLIN